MNLIEETRAIFAGVRAGLVKAMQNLHAIKESGEWTTVASTWGEFLEDQLKISQGFGSKLLTVHNHYLLEANISPEKLEGVDYECLYLAAKTEGSPEEQIEKARSLSRRELREERNEKEPHEHLPIKICKVCSIRL